MTSGESTALGIAVALGIVAILTGFFGLASLYRRQAEPLPSPPPPTRRIAPVNARTLAPPEPAIPEPAAPPPLPIAVSEPAPQPMLELEAPVEPLELPAVGTEDPGAVAPAAPVRKPRRKRAPKANASPPSGMSGDAATTAPVGESD
jgi:type IV secretory pathway VirB10-like protein